MRKPNSQCSTEKARACVVAIDAAKISKASALQLATAAGICTDKALAGQPTVNVALLFEVAELACGSNTRYPVCVRVAFGSNPRRSQ